MRWSEGFEGHLSCVVGGLPVNTKHCSQIFPYSAPTCTLDAHNLCSLIPHQFNDVTGIAEGAPVSSADVTEQTTPIHDIHDLDLLARGQD